jgi:Fe2+ or Zn2+ uptake regulation protein
MERMVSMQRATEMLRNKGISPSYHRVKILAYLLEKKTHPTVEEIYRNLSKEIPTLSKTTVYNTLKIFIDKDIAKSLVAGKNEIRYDATTREHAHFTCSKCHRIYDVELAGILEEDILSEGHKVEDCQIILKGICKNCLSKGN